MLRLFLRHYSTFADKIVIYDNHSTDDSVAIARSNPRCDVRTIGAPENDERNLLWVKGEAWKESRDVADWVICCDVDEYLFHADVRKYLATCTQNGITFPQTKGYELVDQQLPSGNKQIYQAVRRGFFRPLFSKRVVFAPAFIDEVNYAPGCHQSSPTGKVVEDPLCQMKLLHAGSVGWQRLIKRRLAIYSRQSSFNVANGFGKHLQMTPHELERQLEEFRRIAGHLWFLGAGGASLKDYLRAAKRSARRLIGRKVNEPSL
ncbi:MAG: glycosyltransferase family 2 protein [Planctomycetes bacterium]|nr:glycosyltransferase family 2 protein [Planctomycetota bacterium]